MIIKASDIVNRSIDDIWYLSDISGLITLQMDDGAVEATGRSILYSWFFWRFHREIEGLQLLKVHHVGLQKMTATTHPRFMEKVLWSVYDMLKEPDLFQLKAICYEITNDLYNHLNVKLEEYVTSTSLIDYIEFIGDPVIKEIVSNTPPNEDDIEKAKVKIIEYLKRPDIYKNNALKKECESGVTSWGRVLQAIAFRSFATDTDHYFFTVPIMVGFVHGLTTLHDSLIESASSTKALIANSSQISRTENFNKRMQLMAQIITGFADEYDCGSEVFNTMRITKDPTNFTSFLGKYYLKDDGTLGVITKNDRHLIGSRVKIRSVMNCKHRHKGKICKVCFGDLHYNVPQGCNLGFWCSIALCSIISQLVMSTKHFDGDALVYLIYHDENVRRTFDINAKNSMTLKKELVEKNGRLVISIPPMYIGKKDQLMFLEDLELIDTVDSHVVRSKSNIRTFSLSIEDSDGMPMYLSNPMIIGGSKEGAYLSKEMLYHIKRYGWSINEKGHYVIDMTGFDLSKPIITLPQKHMNMLEFQSIVSRYIESMGNDVHKELERLTDFNKESRPIERALTRFMEIVDEKITMNIAHLELYILIFMARNPSVGDYRTPKYGEDFEFIKGSMVFKRRSMGAIMPYQDQYEWLVTVNSYFGHNKMGSPYDGLFMPELYND